MGVLADPGHPNVQQIVIILQKNRFHENWPTPQVMQMQTSFQLQKDFARWPPDLQTPHPHYRFVFHVSPLTPLVGSPTSDESSLTFSAESHCSWIWEFLPKTARLQVWLHTPGKHSECNFTPGADTMSMVSHPGRSREDISSVTIHALSVASRPGADCFTTVKWRLEILKTVVTCEIKSFSNSFEIMSEFYFTYNHVWQWNTIISAAEGVLKLFQNYFSDIQHDTTLILAPHTKVPVYIHVPLGCRAESNLPEYSRTAVEWPTLLLAHWHAAQYSRRHRLHSCTHQTAVKGELNVVKKWKSDDLFYIIMNEIHPRVDQF